MGLSLALGVFLGAANGGQGGGGAAQPTMKRLIPIDANNFQINQRAPNAQYFATQFMRNQGSNDAGTAHEPWRKGPVWVVDSLDALISAGGWKDWAASSGAQDYARNRAAPPNVFGGSFHGGETILSASEVLLIDGVAVTGLAPVDGRLFHMQRTTRVTWSDATTADVVHTMDLSDMKTEITNVHTSSAVMGTLDFPTLGFVSSRFTRLISSAGTVDMSTPNAEYDLTTSIRAFRLLDPIAGDYVDVEFTIDIPVNRLYILWSTSSVYSKFYIKSAGGVLASINVTQKMTYFMATVPKLTLPFTDTFSGTELSALWRQISGTPAGAGSVVSGGEWVVTNDTPVWRWGLALAVDPGTYHIELDYKTDAANTGSVFYVTRSDSGSITNPYVAGVSLNSLAGTTLAFDLVVTDGQVPYLVVSSGVAGRVTRFRELRITKAA